jgi:hypothetical protein
MEIHLEVWKRRQIGDKRKAKRKGADKCEKGHRNVIATYSRFRGIFAPRSQTVQFFNSLQWPVEVPGV